MTVAARLRGPHAMLAAGAAGVLVLEGLRGSATLGTSPVWPALQAGVAALALARAFSERDKLRLVPLLLVAASFQLAWIGIHLGLGVAGDYDAHDLYRLEGGVLRHGTYPRSEYPPLAVFLFAFEGWLGGGPTRVANAFLMLPCELVVVWAVWQFRTRWSPFLAACVALWPLDTFFWEFRYDLLPTVGLVVGLWLAYRGSLQASAIALSLGALAKWTPALAALVLALWLLRSRRVKEAARFTAAFVIPVVLVYAPLLAWRPSETVAAYTFQNSRKVTAESLVYLPFRLLRHAHPGYWYSAAADVSSSDNLAARWFQYVVVAAAVLLVIQARRREVAVAVAALAPAVFLLTNRVFSPQYFVTIVAALAVAAALVCRHRLEVVAVAVTLAVATTANTILYQSYLGVRPVGAVPGWTYVSALALVPAAAVALWLSARTVARSP